MIIFINGKIGGGSPCAGSPFWKPAQAGEPGFIEGAAQFLQDATYYTPPVDFPRLSTASGRFEQGYRFWSAFRAYNSISAADPVHLVAHSMGCAFAEGLANGAVNDGYTIGKVGYINCYQASDLMISTNRQYTIDYQLWDDPLINSRLLSLVGHARPGAIHGANYQLRQYSGISNPLKRHRAPIALWGRTFWTHLAELMA